MSKGRKSVEYLIHFQGWNSSWDRFVPEEFVLKDTQENRQLQKSLAEKSQLQLGVFFYRKERSHQRRQKHLSSLSKPETSEMDKSLGFEILDEDEDEVIILSDVEVEGELEDEDEGEEEEVEEEEEEELDSEREDNGDEDDSDEELPSYHPARPLLVCELEACDIIELDLSKELKRMLEDDQDRIKNHNMFVRIPAKPNILTILEEYVKDYAQALLAPDDESKTDSDHMSMRSKQHSLRMQPPRKRVRRSSSNSSCDGEDIDKDLEQLLRSVRICSQIAYSMMVYIDYTLGDQLLYATEKIQYLEVRDLAEKRRMSDIKLKHNPPPLPVQQRLLARIDSDFDSDDDGKSDTEAELLQMISAMDEGFTQRWNDLLRDAGCDTDPETDPLKTEEDVDKQVNDDDNEVVEDEEERKEMEMLIKEGKIVVFSPGRSSNR
ncbi:hypothetical protein B566_EDAN016029 [Ephemera danica]|nr:hypothetical protein B566_EDAN016029 [Ephemera danica]